MIAVGHDRVFPEGSVSAGSLICANKAGHENGRAFSNAAVCEING